MLDEESLKRVKAKLEADTANGVSQDADTKGVALIPGGVDVTSSITANVWEVHVEVSIRSKRYVTHIYHSTSRHDSTLDSNSAMQHMICLFDNVEL